MDELLAYIKRMQQEAQESWVEWMKDPEGFEMAPALGRMHGHIDQLAFLAARVKREVGA